MSPTKNILGILVLVILLGFISEYFLVIPPSTNGIPQVSNATSTQTAVLPQATTSTKEKTGSAVVEIKKITPTTLTVPSPTQPATPLPVTPPKPAPDFEKINQFARTAIVNILCTDLRAEEVSGTGIVVDQSGIILTNAHIGQYFLLLNYPVKNYFSCVIRTGSPAYPTYTAELTYISPTWISANKTILTETNPTGTGENDFAFLRITGRIDGSPLNPALPFISPDTEENIVKDEPVVLVSYPAGFLGGLFVMKDLNITSAVASIADYFTFDTGTIDLISVPGTVVSQKGSSGGAVVSGDKKLLGIIVTSTDATKTVNRDLRAITVSHIDRSLQSELDISLKQFLALDLAQFGKKFASTTAPLLTKIITTELQKANK